MVKIVGFLAQLMGNRLLIRTGLAKLLSIFVRLVFSCQISPGATFGRRPLLAYGGLGIVIHGASIVGDDVLIGAHVTLGGNFGTGGVPRIGDRVHIGPGAKILGPVRIGNDVIIGANAVVLTDIPDGAIAVGVPAKPLANRSSRREFRERS